MQKRDFDVVVIGGGLAGSVCAARLATQGIRVALVERSAFDRTRVGEVVSVPVLQRLCQLLGLEREACEKVVYRSASFVVNWGDHIARHLPAQVSHCVVDRIALDLLLFEHASQCGVTTWKRTKLSKVARNQDHWSFSLENQQASIDATARLAIEATGRTAYSPFTAARGRMFQDTAVACSLRFECPSLSNSHSVSQIIIESTPQGWWYSCQLSDRDRLVTFFTDLALLPRNCDARNAWLVDQFQSSELLSGYTRALMNNVSTWRCSDARMSIRRQCSGEGWLAIGDAQMALDPLSGHGMQEAARSAMDSVLYAQDALHGAAFDHQAFARSIASRYNDQLEKRGWTYLAEQKWPDSHFWMPRHGWHTLIPMTEDAFANTTMEN